MNPAERDALLSQARIYYGALQAEGQSLKASLDEARERLVAAQQALVQNGDDQARTRQRIAELEAEAKEQA